ncbi:hypothetical protein BCR33DRAFT_786559 [Rhizoclosmatium globosum]|uniref:Threonine/serine exporter-like N-terminal domain-containing protein n=1 Tax=Rhizoclosmatium globosum TaxID=329046 RepID=A0A1Y2C657_9FUNG|nr:hypothetical protein BCR33DRAFT_786559 [Rhizoclosmatium globosum]|eukprot:ORY42364.1 hypothetical protein BCR33DRAFT_786559 [Rhizoclosmatium globosum]
MDAPRYSEEYLPPINPISVSQSRGGTIQNSHDSLPVIESAPTTAEIASKKSTTDELLELLDRFSHHKRVSMSPLNVDDSDDDSDAETLDDFDEVEEDDDQNDKDRAMKRKQTRIARAVTKIENRKRDKHLDQFLVLLGNSLQEYGCPTATMETHMEHVAEGLGRPTRFAFFDGYAFATWKGENGRDQTLLFGTYSGLNLYKLQLCDELTRHVAAYSRPSDRIHTAFFERLNYSPQTKTILRYIGGTLFGVRLRGSYTSYDPEQGSLVNMTDKILELAAVSPNLFGQYKRANSKKLKKKHTTFVITDEGDGRGKKQEPSINRAPTLRHADVDTRRTSTLSTMGIGSYFSIMVCFTCAVFFDGLWNDVAASFVIGLALGVVSLLCSRDWNWMRICEFLSAVIIGFCIRLMSIWNWAICPGSVTIATFINLVQGTNITLAVMELASKHPGAGVSRLGYSLTITALIGIGLQFGNAVASGIAAQTVSNTDLLQNCSAGMSIPTQWGCLFRRCLYCSST